MGNVRRECEQLEVDNSKLAGHHNAQQRINHLLDLKRECEKLKREKKIANKKISALQRKLGKGHSGNFGVNVSASMCVDEKETVSEEKEREALSVLRAKSDEMGEMVSTLLSAVQSISQIGVVGDSLEAQCGQPIESVENGLAVLGAVQRVIDAQGSELAKVRREANGLANDILIRDATIKLLQDKICLSPKINKKAVSKREGLRHRGGAGTATHSHRTKATGRDKKRTTDFQK